jgi:regulator of sigma E protease
MVFDLLLVILGFGFIVFVHELGHFLAARWAGIRVLAFAIGFGPPLLTFRKGIGVRRGSTEREYFERFRQHHQQLVDRAGGDLATRDLGPARDLGISPTEYRLNALPFGGYVKMLGQDDMDATATSAAADSYQRCVPWKRMIVISAGVVMNILIAAILFIIVMTAGRLVEPPTIGGITPGMPAAAATPLDEATTRAFAATGNGLRPGDTVLRLDGDRIRTYDDLFIGVAMSRAGDPIVLDVKRPGVEGVLRMEATPIKTILGPFLDLGVSHAYGARVVLPKQADARQQVDEILKNSGLVGVVAGAELVEVRDAAGQIVVPATSSLVLQVAERSGGKPITAIFANPDASKHDVVIQPVPQLQQGLVALPRASRGKGPSITSLEHVLGLTGVMTVSETSPMAFDQGLRAGDIFAKIGDAEYPAPHEGMSIIRAAKGGTIAITVLRTREDGSVEEVYLPAVRVRRNGTIGFGRGTTSDGLAIIARPVEKLTTRSGATTSTPALSLALPPGTRIIRVDGIVVQSLLDVRTALRLGAERSEGRGWDVELQVSRPVAGRPGASEDSDTVVWQLTSEDARLLREQAWTTSLPLGLFEPEQVVLKAGDPLEALEMGMHETKRVMLSTYLTFVRLAQGSVAFDQLKGPVGIAHIGTILSGRGFIWLLFFLAIISVNLAVVNFLPLPIVDGGQFLFLIYEAIRGKPVPVGVQNVVTMAGLVLIGSLFLMVTYNDIRNLLGV